MKFTSRKLNYFLALKLPSAFLMGVRTKFIDDSKCIVVVKHRWINQNPFNSMFWAVQGMAAELATGALVMNKIKTSNKSVSMLVINNQASFNKKAKGLITFCCTQGLDIDTAIQKAIKTRKAQRFFLSAAGVDSNGDQVCSFDFQWSIKLKS
jgi:hypothetical protein